MKKIKTVIKVVAGAIVIALLIVLFFFSAERVFNPVTLDASIMVHNRVEISYLDTIVSVGATEMDMHDIFIDIRQMDPKDRYTTDGIETMAYVYGGQNVFLIFTQNLSRREAIDVMAHELIHVWQMNSGKLLAPNDGSVTYEGKYYENPKYIPYDQRPWEIEAAVKGKVLALQIREKLYKKE